jgi:hypothetical protein
MNRSLAGLYYMNKDNTKAKFHLSNALRLNYDNYIILEDLFPWFGKENST